MITALMDDSTLSQYISKQSREMQAAIAALDKCWQHGEIVSALLDNAIHEMNQLTPQSDREESIRVEPDRKTEKYTNWVEVMRLAVFQYERFSQRKRARSEGLYSTLLSLAGIWGQGRQYPKILVPGCGPGRSVLDFARSFPESSVTGLDYSFLSLLLGDKIVCYNDNVQLLRRDVFSAEHISSVLDIPGFGLRNAEFCLCDLVSTQLPSCDMIVCSNTLNLLPDHEKAVENLGRALRPGGLLIFADLIGWRLDREPARKLLCSDNAIQKSFERVGLTTLDSFNGVPYIESESDDQETCYNQHFYVGRKQ